MDAARQAGNDQFDRWNGSAGRAWVDARDVLDGMFQRVEDLLVGSIGMADGAQVLDVGCGTGATTLAVARRLGPAGGATGIDLSAPMVAAARERAGREHAEVTFLCADVQEHAFAPATFDAIISRFGVMFFGEPVRAFTALRRAARDAAELRFVAWRRPEENPFMTTAELAAAPFLPPLPAREPDAPGQFAFADPRRVSRILEESGWNEIEVRPVDLECVFPEPALMEYITRFGPVGMVLNDLGERERAPIVKAIRAAFERYVQGAEVRYTAACWLVRARASAPTGAPRV